MHIVIKTCGDDAFGTRITPCHTKEEAIARAAIIAYDHIDELENPDDMSTVRELLLLFKIGNFMGAIEAFNKHHENMSLEIEEYTEAHLSHRHSSDLPEIMLDAGVQLTELDDHITPLSGISIEFDEDEED